MQNYTFGAVCHVTSATILHQWFRLDEICRPKKGVTELLFYTHTVPSMYGTFTYIWWIFYGKCRWICQSPGCVMGFLWAFLASENFHGEKIIAAKIGTWATKEQLATWHLARLRLVMKHGTFFPCELNTGFQRNLCIYIYIHISYMSQSLPSWWKFLLMVSMKKSISRDMNQHKHI